MDSIVGSQTCHLISKKREPTWNISHDGRHVHLAIFLDRNVDPPTLCGGLLNRIQHLRHSPSLFEVAIGATILSDGIQPFVDLDRLELVNAERDACEGPESTVVSVTRAEFDLAVTLALDGVAGQIQPQCMDVLLNELERALASDQLDALVPGAPRRHARRFNVTAGAVRELDQERRRVVVLDRTPGRFEIGATPVPEYAGGLGTGLDEGPTQTRDGADRSNEDVSERDDVRTQVAQRAGPGKLALETPGERHVGICACVEDEPARERPD